MIEIGTETKLSAEDIIQDQYNTSKYSNLIDANIFTKEQIKALLIAKKFVNNKQFLPENEKKLIYDYLEKITQPIPLKKSKPINSILHYFNYQKETENDYQSKIKLESKQYQIIKNIGDGDCLFISLLEGLKKIIPEFKYDNHLSLREAIVNQLRNINNFVRYNLEGEIFNDEFIPEYINLNKEKVIVESKEDYINQLKKSGIWAGDYEIFSASKLFNINIIVYTSKSDIILYKCDNEEIEKSCKTVYLYYSGDNHFEYMMEHKIDLERKESPFNLEIKESSVKSEIKEEQKLKPIYIKYLRNSSNKNNRYLIKYFNQPRQLSNLALLNDKKLNII